MKPNPKLTPWFTNGEKPAYKGVYNVSCKKENQTGEWYSYWDGLHFCPFSGSTEGAYRYSYLGNRYTNEEGSWRGLAEQPA